MSEIKAIETIYKGYRFRSRLEARWAVFFDALGIEWEYEKEGYDLGAAGWYLPDFWLPKHGYWIEVKPSEPLAGSNDHLKIAALATALSRDVYIAVGPPGPPYDFRYSDRIQTYFRPVHPGGNFASHAWWCWCRSCGGYLLSVFGHLHETCPLCGQAADAGRVGLAREIDGIGIAHPAIDEAYTAARSARFEHGESPKA